MRVRVRACVRACARARAHGNTRRDLLDTQASGRGSRAPSSAHGGRRARRGACGVGDLAHIECLKPRGVLQKPPRQHAPAQPDEQHAARQARRARRGGGGNHRGSKNQALGGMEGKGVPIWKEVSVSRRGHPMRDKGGSSNGTKREGHRTVLDLMADCQTSGLFENHNVRMEPPSAENSNCDNLNFVENVFLVPWATS